MFIPFRNTIALFVFLTVLLSTPLDGAEQTEIRTSDSVPDYIVASGLKHGPQYAIIVEKRTQTLFLFVHESKKTRELLRFPCSTGEVPGPKTQSGDSKTPEGIYFFVKEHLEKDLSPIYGTRAYPIDYPNILDRLAGRDGNSIWLHGTNKPLKPRDSNGCIVLENSNIDTLSKYIALNETPIIIVENLLYSHNNTPEAVENTLYGLLNGWTQALQNGDYHDFLSFYDPDYLPDITWWADWNRLRNGIDNRIAIVSSPVSIYRHRNLYVLLFDQLFKPPAGEKPVGKRKLFIRQNGNHYRIIGDEYLTTAIDPKVSPAESPLVAVYKTFTAEIPKESGIEDMIDGWLKAWSSKDIQTYGDYYANRFWSQGMDRQRWLSYKDRLNKKYAYIKVTVENLKIEKDENRRIATFRQTYESPEYRAEGIKKLVLVWEDGRWKIFRETWSKR